jgi:tetratricopeptide (TPR) repeat protein
MLKLLLFVFFFLIPFPLMSGAQNIKRSSPTVLEYNNSYPLVISLANEKNDGSWVLKKDSPKNTAPLISVANLRQGYLFTYFTLKATPQFKGIVTFQYINKDRVLKERSFYLQENKRMYQTGNPLFGDVPPESKGDGFLDQVENTNPENVTQAPLQHDNSMQNNSSKTLEDGSSFSLKPLSPDPNIANTQNSTPQGSTNSLQNPSLPSEQNPPGSPFNLSHSSLPQDEPSLTQEKPKGPISKEIKAYLNNLIKANLFEQARVVFDEYVSNNPPDDDNWKALTDIKISFGAKQYQQVVDKIKELLKDQNLEQNPLTSETQFSLRENLALAYENLNNPQDAEAQFLYLQTYFKNNPYAYYNLGKFYLRQKKLDKAVTHFTTLITQNPDFAYADEIYFELGNYYYQVVGVNGYNLSLNYYKKVLNFGLSSAFYTKAKQKVDFLENNFFNIQ